MPISVARGMVRAGSRTLSAATLADSKPSNAQSVNAADAVMPAPVRPCAGKGSTCALPLLRMIASTTNATRIGTSLMQVVAICVRPAARAPIRLIPVIAHRNAMEQTAPRPGLVSTGMMLLRLAVAATAMVTLVMMMEIQ